MTVAASVMKACSHQYLCEMRSRLRCSERPPLVAARAGRPAERGRAQTRLARRRRGLIHGDDDLHAFLDLRALDRGLLTIGKSRANTRHRELAGLIEIPEYGWQLTATLTPAGKRGAA